MERTDSILRMLKVNLASSQDDAQKFSWSPALQIFTYLNDDEIATLGQNSREVLCYMITNRDNSNSVFNLVVSARENARSVQDNITIELWQCLNDYYHLIRDPWVERTLQEGDPVSVLDALIRQGTLYYGIVEYTMFKGVGLRFLNVGRYLERSIQSTVILDIKLRDISYDLDRTADTMYWKYLLMSISGYALYLKSYKSGFEARNVIDQILLNDNFPRSLVYSLRMLQRNYDALQSSSDEATFRKLQFMIGKLYSKVKYADVDTIHELGLREYLHGVHDDLTAVGNAFNKLYFAYA